MRAYNKNTNTRIDYMKGTTMEKRIYTAGGIKIEVDKHEDKKAKERRMVAPDKKTLKKSVKSMFFMVQTRCEVETIKY